MVHLYRSKSRQKAGTPKKKDQFYTTLVVPGEVIYTSERVKNKQDAFKTPYAAGLNIFGAIWDGKYMDHTDTGKPVERVFDVNKLASKLIVEDLSNDATTDTGY